MVQWEIWDSEAWERKQKLHNLNWRRDVHRETHNAPFLMPGGKANHVFISFKNPPGLPSRVLNSWTEGADPAAGLRTPLPTQVAPRMPRQRVDGGWMCVISASALFHGAPQWARTASSASHYICRRQLRARKETLQTLGSWNGCNARAERFSL